MTYICGTFDARWRNEQKPFYHTNSQRSLFARRQNCDSLILSMVSLPEINSIQILDSFSAQQLKL
ncbi:MAG: hypothetical protein D6714_12160 [Bacteroidetes bacterium]|nr:MAG: hypothetical protein D6714_12160 [Bacteroidota bacterium]